jgi:hypothetical protein
MVALRTIAPVKDGTLSGDGALASTCAAAGVPASQLSNEAHATPAINEPKRMAQMRALFVLRRSNTPQPRSRRERIDQLSSSRVTPAFFRCSSRRS